MMSAEASETVTTDQVTGDYPDEEGDPEETEDEEVKVNCAGGFNGIRDSDLSSEDESECGDDESAGSYEDPQFDSAINEEKPRARAGLVHFVNTQHSLNGLNIRRPQAVMGIPSVQKDPSEDEDDASSMDESSTSSSSYGARGLGLSLEVTRLHESSDDDSISSYSSGGEGDASSARGVAGSDSENESSDDDEKGQGDNERNEADEDAIMSDDESDSSVPHACFENCDAPSDVAELERALQDSKHDDAVKESDPNQPSALLSEITELEPKSSMDNAFTKAKRVLSSSALAGPASASAPSVLLSPKRVRRVPEVDEGSMPDFSLGPVADDEAVSSGFMLKPRYKEDPLVSPSDEEEEEQDRQLSEELEQAEKEQERENTPIPLLTPPASPLRVESEEGNVTVCEWPSNLTVDSAMVAAIDIRPPSPKSLQAWEQKEEERVMAGCASADLSPDSPPDMTVRSTSLTPMLRGISVEGDAPFLSL